MYLLIGLAVILAAALLAAILAIARLKRSHSEMEALLRQRTEALAREVAERSRHDEAMAERARELQRSNAELEQFAYIASHDLQEPLRMVASYTELLAQRYQGKLDERADKYIKYAVDGAKRMQRLVNDLLTFSRVGRHTREPQPTDLNDVVQTVLKNLGHAIGKSGVTIETGKLPIVMADDGQIGQVFQNLLGNAIKFRAERTPHIRVAAERTTDKWLCSVKDNGIGIEPQYSDRIFQMFQRLHDRETYEGSGIGLAIAKKIVERHGGRIWFESVPGEGTTFFFTLAAEKAA
ncbi:MAG TPA: ATP-binding protein [Rhizomicrobium sp.]|nr:ATP-binding protein [Rhizomicrobium sp.]